MDDEFRNSEEESEEDAPEGTIAEEDLDGEDEDELDGFHDVDESEEEEENF